MKIIFMIFAAVIGLAACSHISSVRVQTEGTRIDKTRVEEIKPGATTKADIIAMFGNPVKSESRADGAEALTFSYMEKKTPTYFGEFVVNERQAKTEINILEIIVKDGIVSSYDFKKEEKQ